MKYKELLLALLVLSIFACDRGGQGATAPEGPTLVDEVSDTGCPHPLMPFAKGARWTYVLGADPSDASPTAELTVLDVTERAGQKIALVERSVGLSTTTVEIACSARKGTSFLGLFVPLGAPVPQLVKQAPSITKRTGALLPPFSELRPRGEWTYELTAHTELRGHAVLTMDSLWSVSAQWLRTKHVEVPAGRYEVTQVKLTTSVHHRPPEEEDVTVSERAMDPPPMVFTYSFARGVGVVLIEGEPLPDRPHIRARWALKSLRRPD